jgi:hypothetical protein
MDAMISLRATRGAVLRETGFPHDEQPGALTRRLFFDRSLAEEQRGQFRAVHSAEIVRADRFPLRTISGQKAKHQRDSEVSPVAGDQRSSRYRPARSHLVHATASTAVRSATSPRVIDPEVSIVSSFSAAAQLPTNGPAHTYGPTMTIVPCDGLSRSPASGTI